MPPTNKEQRFNSISEFYPFYLSEHNHVLNRRLHFAGTSCALILLAIMLLGGNLWYLVMAFVAAYGFAWTGHFCFEHNKPATFKYPLYSFICDFIMYKDVWIGRISLVS